MRQTRPAIRRRHLYGNAGARSRSAIGRPRLRLTVVKPGGEVFFSTLNRNGKSADGGRRRWYILRAWCQKART